MCHLDSSHYDVGTCTQVPARPSAPSLIPRQLAGSSSSSTRVARVGAAQRSWSPIQHMTRRMLSGRQGLHFGTDAARTRLSLGALGIQPLSKPGRTSPELSASLGLLSKPGVAARRRSWSCSRAPGALLHLALPEVPLPMVLQAMWAQRGCLLSTLCHAFSSTEPFLANVTCCCPGNRSEQQTWSLHSQIQPHGALCLWECACEVQRVISP